MSLRNVSAGSRWLMGLGLLLGLSAGAKAQQQTSAQESTTLPLATPTGVTPDAQIEANVLKALAASPVLENQSISSTTIYGVVTLTGSVKDSTSRDQAEKVVSTTAGVKKVVDELTIGVLPGDAAGNNGNDGNAEAGAQAGTNSGLQSDGTAAPPSGNLDGPRGASGTPGDPQANNPDGGWTGDYPLPSDRPPPPAAPYGSRGRGPGNDPSAQQEEQPRPPQQGGVAVSVPQGSLLRVRIDEGVDSQHAQIGTVFHAVVLSDVMVGYSIAIPRGAEALGAVIDAQGAGSLTGKGMVALTLTQVMMDGRNYPLVTDAWSRESMSKTPQAVSDSAGLGAAGALVGAVAGGGPGALLGAGLGGAAGLGVSAASGNGTVVIPAEAILSFHLQQPVNVVTLPQAELDSLRAGVPRLSQPPGSRRLRPVS